ncbi:MAG TPA: carbamoyltransferase N-terminal domain-containing protein, partial [Thermoanaerobaculia bacterium]
MYILGINAYHGGASACLIKDGQLISAVEEERFSRIKYQAGFPVTAIRHVLSEAGITPYDVDHVGISRNPSANLVQKALFAFRKRPSLDFVKNRLQNAMKVGQLKDVFIERMELKADSVKAQFHNVEHHRAHISSAFYVSPYKRAAVLSVDGMGDFVSGMWGTAEDTKLNIKDEVNFPHSLGIYYTAVTQWLGFPKYGDEGKVMGLAPYGEPKYIDKMRKIVRIQKDGTYELDLDYFVHHAEGVTMSWTESEPVLGPLFSEHFVKEFGDPRVPRTELTKYHEDIAASMQVMLEEAEFALVRKLAKETGEKALCMAGGVALNSSFNGKVLPGTTFEDIFIQPAAGDAGTSLGV